jgi:hypothetical protein
MKRLETPIIVFINIYLYTKRYNITIVITIPSFPFAILCIHMESENN